MSSSPRIVSSIAVSSVLLFFAGSALAASGPAGIVAALEKKYTVTELTPDRQQVVTEGTVMAVQCSGIYSEDSFPPDNKYIGPGKVQAGAAAKLFYTKATHIMQPGEKVYITKIETKSEAQDDVLKITIATVDLINVPGGDSQERYAATISAKFKKGYLDDASPQDIEQGLETILAPDTGSGNNAAASPQAPPQSRPAVQQVVAPPPPQPEPPPAAPTTITLGESSTQVLQAMGMPQQMIDLGKKKTYVYKNMKIVFVDDKVTDVQ
jgi:hypothetical protein